MTKSAAFTSGTLEKTPLYFLLTALLDRQSTGTLVMERPDGAKSALRVVTGIPTKLKSAEATPQLGGLLVEYGYLSERDRESSYQAAVQAKKLHGRYLVDTGALSTELLTRALRSQLLRKLRGTADLPPATAFGFYENQDFLQRWAGEGLRVSPLLAIWHLIRSTSDLPSLVEFRKTWDSSALTLQSGAELDGFGFDTAEQALVRTLQAKPQTVDQLKCLNVVSHDVVDRIVYVLKITRQFQQVPAINPLGVGMSLQADIDTLKQRPARKATQTQPDLAPHPSLSTQPNLEQAQVPNNLSPEDANRRAALMRLAEESERVDFYALLGVERDATTERIQAAYFDLAKRYHPDRLGPEFLDLRAMSARLFARLTEAQQILADARLRRQYDDKLKQDSGTADDEQQRIQEIVNAATCFQKAEVLFKRRMLAAAEAEARRAYEGDPGQADYLALLAWIQANKPDSVDTLPVALIQLNTAVRMSPESEKIRFYRGQVLSRLGRHQEAVQDFKLVVSKNPHNIDASREIRLWEMRQKTQHSGQPSREQSVRQTNPGSTSTVQPTSSTHSSRPRSNSTHDAIPKGNMFSKLFKR